MKHTLKITTILLAMFIITQFIGLYVVDHYATTKVINGVVVNVSNTSQLPFGLETPEIKDTKEYNILFVSIIFAFIIAILLLIILMKFRAEIILKLWFFMVVIIALGISFNSFMPKMQYATAMVLILAIPLAFIKIYGRGFLVHNFTELFIYPGIAAVFVPILNIYTIIFLLILISIYDMWAVWHSGIMQKMAKYQMNSLNVFSGFFVPYVSDKLRAKLKKMKKSKSGKGIKVNVAILGGGDVIFPIITAGVVMKTFGLIPAIFVIAGATIGLSYLFFFAEKKKFYPAMPFITTGIFLGMILSWALHL